MNPNQPSSNQGNFGNPAPVNLDDTFKYAPKREGDPWDILLQPEIEADRVRCDSWKEEVQSLLIFAGLFSSVVTSFVINSYQTLQPSPNNIIIGLLFHIANGLNNSSPFPPSVNPEDILAPFSQTPSATRINMLWFLSLILSLTTALIGTVALQWIREHQSYPNCSSKEKLAILRMRSQAMDAWHVPSIFSALPLLLQTLALILFLSGLIDFSFLLGTKIITTVCVAVGLTILFLATTTAFPAIQSVSLFFRNLKIPSPCPFRSPQSDAFRALIGFISRIFFILFRSCALCHDDIYFEVSPLPQVRRHLAPYIYDILQGNPGPTFDRQWLSLRDACHQRSIDKGPELYEDRQMWPEWRGNSSNFPLSDVTQCVLKSLRAYPGTKYYTEAFITAAYHCLSELSASIWNAECQEEFYYLGPKRLTHQDRRSHYLEQLLKNPYNETTCSLCDFLIHNGNYRYTSDWMDIDNYLHIQNDSTLFHLDHNCLFLDLIPREYLPRALDHYKLELLSRLVQYVFTNRVAEMSIAIGNQVEPSLHPAIFDISAFRLHPLEGFAATVNILNTILNAAASHNISSGRLNFLSSNQVYKLIGKLAVLTDEYLRWARRSPNVFDVRKIGNQYKATFEFASNHLAAEISSPDLHATNLPCIFFYLSSIFAWKWLQTLPDLDSLQHQRNFTEGMQSFLRTLQSYRPTILDRQDSTIEAHLQFGSDYMQFWDNDLRALVIVEPFSPEWWDKLDKESDEIISLPNIESRPTHSFPLPPDLPIQRLIVDPENCGDADASSLDPSIQLPIPQPIPSNLELSVSLSASPHSPATRSRTPIPIPDILNVLDNQVDGRSQGSPLNSELSLNRSCSSNSVSNGPAIPHVRSSSNNESTLAALQLQSSMSNAPSLETTGNQKQSEEFTNDGPQHHDNVSLNNGAPSQIVPTPLTMTTDVDVLLQDDKEPSDSIIDIQSRE